MPIPTPQPAQILRQQLCSYFKLLLSSTSKKNNSFFTEIKKQIMFSHSTISWQPAASELKESNIQRPLGISMRQIQVADQTLVIHELDNVSDPATGRVLTGSWVWGSALVLSNWMATQGPAHFHFQDKSVLELGAGAGLPGLTAARLGASQVVLTDIGPLLPGLQRNVEANRVGDRVEVRELVWGSDESLSRTGEFDLVLMSDVFYNPEEMVGLARTLKSVCGRGTSIWGATEVRPWTAECLSELVNEGFGLVEFELPSQVGFHCLEGTEERLDCFAVFQVIPPHEYSHQVAAICDEDYTTRGLLS